MRVRPTIILLAAGRGQRFEGDQHKLAMAFGAGTVLGTAISRAVQSQLPVLVVTTATLAPIARKQLATRDVLVLDAEDAERGMGASIAAGVAERSGSAGWLLLPADMPMVKPSSLLAVASALENHVVVVAEHRGRRGHPVGFSAELYSELVKLQGDEGARRIVARYPAHGLDLADPGVLLDIDTVADLQALRAQIQDESPAPSSL